MANAYPVIEETVRPFRLWNPVTSTHYPWRAYKYHRNAIIGALIECKWAKVGTVIEVVDVRYGKLIGQYLRQEHSVTFHKEKSNVED